MGLPARWVTDPAHQLTQNQQITALGNGVLPLQATQAIHAATRPANLDAQGGDIRKHKHNQ